MFKVIADVIEFDGYIVGTIGDMPATVKGRLIDALEDYTEECAQCKEYEAELDGPCNECVNYEDVIADLDNEADKLATMLTDVEGERDRYKAILGLTS